MQSFHLLSWHDDLRWCINTWFSLLVQFGTICFLDENATTTCCVRYVGFALASDKWSPFCHQKWVELYQTCVTKKIYSIYWKNKGNGNVLYIHKIDCTCFVILSLKEVFSNISFECYNVGYFAQWIILMLHFKLVHRSLSLLMYIAPLDSAVKINISILLKRIENQSSGTIKY